TSVIHEKNKKSRVRFKYMHDQELVTCVYIEEYKKILEQMSNERYRFVIAYITGNLVSGLYKTGTVRVMFMDTTNKDDSCVVEYPAFNLNGKIHVILTILQKFKD